MGSRTAPQCDKAMAHHHSPASYGYSSKNFVHCDNRLYHSYFLIWMIMIRLLFFVFWNLNRSMWTSRVSRGHHDWASNWIGGVKYLQPWGSTMAGTQHNSTQPTNLPPLRRPSCTNSALSGRTHIVLLHDFGHGTWRWDLHHCSCDVHETSQVRCVPWRLPQLWPVVANRHGGAVRVRDKSKAMAGIPLRMAWLWWITSEWLDSCGQSWPTVSNGCKKRYAWPMLNHWCWLISELPLVSDTSIAPPLAMMNH